MIIISLSSSNCCQPATTEQQTETALTTIYSTTTKYIFKNPFSSEQECQSMSEACSVSSGWRVVDGSADFTDLILIIIINFI